jgi:hypothetical protein
MDSVFVDIQSEIEFILLEVCFDSCSRIRLRVNLAEVISLAATRLSVRISH